MKKNIQTNVQVDKKRKSDISLKLPKIKLGTGRLMAEIDYDAVFGNILTK